MRPEAKLVAGALLIGVGIVSGDATIFTIAGNVGANWASEGVSGLWDRFTPVPAPGSPLQRAYQQAIEKAARGLRAEYLERHDARADPQAFDLVAATSRELSSAAIPATTNLDAAQQALDDGLALLLHGHDPRQVEFLQRNLIPAVARAFRAELVADDKAWRQFHGELVEQLTRRADQFATRAQVDAVLTQLRDQNAAARALADSAARLETLLAALPQSTAPGTVLNFNNQGMQAREAYQGQNLYIKSAHAEGGGTAIVFNREEDDPE